MKKFGLLGVLLSAAVLVSCSGGGNTEETVTETSTETTITETFTETTISETTVTETSAETETEEKVPETAAETAQESAEEYVQVSPDNEFIDFEFIEDYQGTTDIGDLADRAVEFLKQSEFYSESMKNIAEFTDEEFVPYIKDGVVVPIFNMAYPADYDGDGNTETFIIIKMPYSPLGLMDGLVTVRDFVVFADKDGNMEIIDETCN
ncbi:MAG: hypothetical protein K2G04_03615, partial [Oscillospiraceae bacterium]|nr:hypothetical protein [Oscillospiraceae bacterium]